MSRFSLQVSQEAPLQETGGNRFLEMKNANRFCKACFFSILFVCFIIQEFQIENRN